MKNVQIRDEIHKIINLLIVASIAQENCADKEKPISLVMDFAIPALEKIQKDLAD